MTDKDDTTFSLRLADEYILTPQDPATKIWRYMDFTKFVSMLETRALYFSRADLLGDPFEGSKTDYKVNRLLNSAFEQVSHSSKFNEIQRELVYINCWHMNQVESAAMWQLYARTEEAVAIQSTFSKLEESVGDVSTVCLVRYIDYERDPIGGAHVLPRYIHKRKSFAHEKEVRAIICDQIDVDRLLDRAADKDVPLNQAPGKQIEIDLNDVLEKIFVAPDSPPWFFDLVKKIAVKYGIDLELQQSNLDKEPIF